MLKSPKKVFDFPNAWVGLAELKRSHTSQRLLRRGEPAVSFLTAAEHLDGALKGRCEPEDPLGLVRFQCLPSRKRPLRYVDDVRENRTVHTEEIPELFKGLGRQALLDA